jgi:hypothetical protein
MREAILARIETLRSRSSVRGFVWAIALNIASIFVAVLSFAHISASLSSSGVYDYAGLVLSEGFGVFGYAREFLMSLAESVPVLAVAGAFGAALFLGWSTLRVINSRPSSFTYHAI